MVASITVDVINVWFKNHLIYLSLLMMTSHSQIVLSILKLVTIAAPTIDANFFLNELAVELVVQQKIPS